jgi:hypothetical protein
MIWGVYLVLFPPPDHMVSHGCIAPSKQIKEQYFLVCRYYVTEVILSLVIQRCVTPVVTSPASLLVCLSTNNFLCFHLYSVPVLRVE